MTRPGERERRPFYACDSCGVIYARHGQPEACAVCGSETFVEVMPKEVTY